MTSELHTVTVDAADPRRLAEFWSAMLGYKVVYDSRGGSGDPEARRERPRRSLRQERRDAKSGQEPDALRPESRATRTRRSSARCRSAPTHVDIGQAAIPMSPGRSLPTPRATSSAS